VCFFRHALALDEVKGVFNPEYAIGGATISTTPTIKEMWFAGNHIDMYVTQL